MDNAQEAADALSNFLDSISEYTNIEVSVEEDDYYFDLGVFGESSTSVRLEDSHYEIDLESVINNHSSWSIGSIREVVEFLNDLDEAKPPATLDEVLDRMIASGTEREQALAGAVKVLVAMATAQPTSFSAPAPVGGAPLPETPAPWPGALNPSIEYTAADFPLRYLPPPGFDWATEEATSVDDIGNAVMILDHKGRVSYSQRDDDTLATGVRWTLWHRERDGIYSAKGFTYDTPPRALSHDGTVLVEPHTQGTQYADGSRNWDGIGEYERMKALLEERGAEYHASVGRPIVATVGAPVPAFEAPKPVDV